MEAEKLLDHLDALIVLYMNEYLRDMQAALINPDYQSSFAPLIERATKAHEGLSQYPDLANDIYADFKDEFNTYEREIKLMFAMRKKRK